MQLTNLKNEKSKSMVLASAQGGVKAFLLGLDMAEGITWRDRAREPERSCSYNKVTPKRAHQSKYGLIHSQGQNPHDPITF
jgi:hypothetical protein